METELYQKITVKLRDGYRQVVVVIQDEVDEDAAASQAAYEDGGFTVDDLLGSLTEGATVEVRENDQTNLYDFRSFRNGMVLGDLVDAGQVVSVEFEDLPAGTGILAEA